MLTSEGFRAQLNEWGICKCDEATELKYIDVEGNINLGDIRVRVAGGNKKKIEESVRKYNDAANKLAGWMQHGGDKLMTELREMLSNLCLLYVRSAEAKEIDIGLCNKDRSAIPPEKKRLELIKFIQRQTEIWLREFDYDQKYKVLKQWSQRLRPHIDLYLSGRLECKGDKNARDELLRYNIASSSYLMHRIMNEFLKLKIGRVEELAKIDENIAETYLRYNPIAMHDISARINKEASPQNLQLTTHEILRFISADNVVYQSILDHFKVSEEPAKPAEPTKAEEQHKPAYIAPLTSKDNQTLLKEAINSHNGRHLSSDAETRIQYFAEDAEKHGADYRALAESFSKFNLGKHLKKQ
jgi:hypothetical protein